MTASFDSNVDQISDGTIVPGRESELESRLCEEIMHTSEVLREVNLSHFPYATYEAKEAESQADIYSVLHSSRNMKIAKEYHRRQCSCYIGDTVQSWLG